MARSTTSDTPASATDNGDASLRSQQELYGRPEPTDLDEGRIGRDDEEPDAADAAPGRDLDASGQPSTARAGANTQ